MPSWVFLCPHPVQPEVPRAALPLCSLELVIRELAYALVKAGQEVRVLAPEATRLQLDGFDLLPEGDLLSLASAAEVDVLVRVGSASLEGTRAIRGLRLRWDPFAEGADWRGADLRSGTELLPIVLAPEPVPAERAAGRLTLALCDGLGLVASLLVEQHRADGLLFVGWRSLLAPKGALAARPSSYAEAASLMAQASAFVSTSGVAAETEPWSALATELGVPGGRTEEGPGMGLQRWLALAEAVRIGLDRFRGTDWRGPTTAVLPPQAIRLIADFIGARPLAWEGAAPAELADLMEGWAASADLPAKGHWYLSSTGAPAQPEGPELVLPVLSDLRGERLELRVQLPLSPTPTSHPARWRLWRRRPRLGLAIAVREGGYLTAALPFRSMLSGLRVMQIGGGFDIEVPAMGVQVEAARFDDLDSALASLPAWTGMDRIIVLTAGDWVKDPLALHEATGSLRLPLVRQVEEGRAYPVPRVVDPAGGGSPGPVVADSVVLKDESFSAQLNRRLRHPRCSVASQVAADLLDALPEGDERALGQAIDTFSSQVIQPGLWGLFHDLRPRWERALARAGLPVVRLAGGPPFLRPTDALSHVTAFAPAERGS